MAESYYHVIFKGEIAEGQRLEDVKNRLALIFKIDISKVDVFFRKVPVVVKKNISYETSVRLKKAFEKAGARVKIVAADKSSAEKKSHIEVQKSQMAANTGSDNLILNGKPKIVSPKLASTSLIYTPLPGHHVEGWEGGIDFKRQYISKILYEQILLLSVFKKIDMTDEKLLILIFIKGNERPIIVNADSIRYTDFPSVAGSNTISSLRNFVIFLFNHNPSLKVDELTYDFMLSMPPRVYEKDIVILSTAFALEIENEIKPKGEKPISQSIMLRLPSFDKPLTSDNQQNNKSSHKPGSVTITCPKCDHKQKKSDECLKCGIIFKKHKKTGQTKSTLVEHPVPNNNLSTAKENDISEKGHVSSQKKTESGFFKKVMSFKSKK